jgi:hypothetical protein
LWSGQLLGLVFDAVAPLQPEHGLWNHFFLTLFSSAPTSMAEPFSIAAGALGITSLATTAPRQLYELINKFREAPAEVENIRTNLESYRRPLTALLDFISSDVSLVAAQDDLKQVGLVEAVNSCAYECDEFGKKLQRWTRHSPNSGQLSFWDKFLVGVAKKEKICTFSTQLQVCAGTVQLAVETVQLWVEHIGRRMYLTRYSRVQLRSATLSEADREATRTQLGAVKDNIEEHLRLMKVQFERTSKRIEELECNDDGSDEVDQAIEEAQKRAELIKAGRVSCGVVFAQAESSRSGIDIGKVLTTEKSLAFVGLPQGVVGKVNLRLRRLRRKESQLRMLAYLLVTSGCSVASTGAKPITKLVRIWHPVQQLCDTFRTSSARCVQKYRALSSLVASLVTHIFYPFKRAMISASCLGFIFPLLEFQKIAWLPDMSLRRHVSNQS